MAFTKLQVITPRSVRIQQTILDGISHNSLIRYQNEAFFDVLES
jgi:hypothetical protein